MVVLGAAGLGVLQWIAHLLGISPPTTASGGQ
jgi:hypothetical protein